MEKWDIYNHKRERTGKFMFRVEECKPGDYHLVVHICLFNERGEMLIQHRQPTQDNWPDLWDISSGGSVLYGEDSCAAASRELFEELGIEKDFSMTSPHLTSVFDAGFDDYYLVKDFNLRIDDIPFSTNEVKAIKWASLEKIIAMIKSGEFISYKIPFIETLFAMVECRGALTEKVIK